VNKSLLKLFPRFVVPNTCTWDFPDVIKFRVASHTISEKVIRFRHPDYNPDRAQKLISSSMSQHLSTRNISNPCTRFKVISLTDRQTDRQKNERGQTHLPSPLSEVQFFSDSQCIGLRLQPYILYIIAASVNDSKQATLPSAVYATSRYT